MLNTWRRILPAVMICAISATAETIIDTRPSGSGSIAPFGESNTATYGQTITAPTTDTVLDYFGFLVDDDANPDSVDFRAYVMAWSGTQATGAVLYESTTTTTSNNGGNGGFELLGFNTGGIQLVGGAQYVLFFSASKDFDGVYGTSSWQTASPVYSGGEMVWNNNGADFSSLTSSAWSCVGCNIELAFVAQFSSPSEVPEPSTWALCLAGVAGLAASRLRRFSTVSSRS